MTKLYRLDISGLARHQVKELNSWWRKNRTAAPTAVRDELARAFRLILAQPRIGPPALDVELPEVRRIHLSRIAHYLYYRLLESNGVVGDDAIRDRDPPGTARRIGLGE